MRAALLIAMVLAIAIALVLTLTPFKPGQSGTESEAGSPPAASPDDVPTPTASPDDVPTPTAPPDDVPTPTASPDDVPTPTAPPDDVPTPTASPDDVPTPTAPPDDVPTPTASPDDVPTPTAPPEDFPTPTALPDDVPTPTAPPDDVPTPTASPDDVPTPTAPPDDVPTPTAPPDDVPTPTASPDDVPTPAAPPDDVPTPDAPPDDVPTPTASPEDVPTPAASPDDVPTPTASPEEVPTPSASPDDVLTLTDDVPTPDAPPEDVPPPAAADEVPPPTDPAPDPPSSSDQPLGKETETAEAAVTPSESVEETKERRRQEAAARSPEAAAREDRKEKEAERKRRTVAPDELTLQLRRTDTGFSGLFKYGPISVLAEGSQKLNDELEDAIGLRLGAAYTFLFQQATDSPFGPDNAAGGDFDFFGRWRLIDTDTTTGQIGFLLENRHRFTDIPPATLNQSIGSLWRTTRAFNEFNFTMRELWWDQSLFNGRLHYRIGTINQKHFIDLYRFKSQNFDFLSTPFSDSPTIRFPRNGFGAMLQVSPIEILHVTATIGDANGQNVGNPSQFFTEGEFFTSIEGAATPTFDGLGEGRYSVTFWHIDKRSDEDIPSGRGFSLLAEQEVVKDVFPFFRYGYGDGADLDIEHLVVAGVGIQKPFGQPGDSFGVGFSWGRPSSGALRDQWGGEIYYRLQVTRAIQLTPGFQFIVNPSANPTSDLVGVFQLRARVDF